MTRQPDEIALGDAGDALVGLRFEVGGGLSRMSGRILGKTAGLYLVQKVGADYCELLQIDDLRSAKFYRDPPEPPPAAIVHVALVQEAPVIVAPAAPPVAEPPAPEPAPRRLTDQLRRNLGRLGGDPG